MSAIEFNRQGQEHYKQGRLEEALGLFKQAVEADARHFPSRTL